MVESEDLFMINDTLGELADQLGVEWSSDDERDDTLDTLTHLICEHFKL